jgi:glycosyltransferase involved in cell wall biosynthesis
MQVDILYAHQDGLVTGSAISLRNLLAALNREMYEPRVAMFSEGPARELYEALGISVDVVPARPFWTFPGGHWTELSFYRNFLALLPNERWKAYLEERRPGIVHVDDKSCLQAGMAAHQLDIPIVWHLRSSYAPSRSRLHAKISARVIRHRADRLIAISEDEMDGFEDCTNLNVVHNSLDLVEASLAMSRREAIRAELGIGPHEIVVGLMAQLNAVRGAWDFIAMAGRVMALAPQISFRFIIASSTSPDSIAQAHSLARQHGIEEQLILTGFRSDAMALIAALDILVVCNHLGVLGRPPFEAMAVGTSVAAWSGHSQRSSVVRDEETALLAPRGDVNALAQAVARLAVDASLRKAIGARGRDYAREHFDPHNNARRVEVIYDELLGVGR